MVKRWHWLVTVGMGSYASGAGAWWLALMMVFLPTRMAGQERPRPLLWDITRSVLIDPTTYAPSVVSFEAQRRDWKTSQTFFAHGWLEQNPRFTISGRAGDVPIAYAAGNAAIRNSALLTLQWSMINNLGANVGERVLTERFPDHVKFIHVLSWAERISVASYVGYLASAEHFRQARENSRLAKANGYAP